MLKKGFGNFIMNNDKEFLATEPIGKLLLRLAIPTLAAQMINMLYNIIDRIYIGHIPGSGALALTGVGVCMPLKSGSPKPSTGNCCVRSSTSGSQTALTSRT